jgi:hypothetical protein
MRTLTISFGGRHHAEVTKTRQVEWPQLVGWLTAEPPETATKEDKGWYCTAEFSDDYRHSDNYVARHAITLDFDHVDPWAFDAVAELLKDFAFAQYTTFSHTDEKPRFRVVMPLSRPAGYDEFQAVVRRVGEMIGIELVARESFTPCQFMFAPCRPVGSDNWRSHWNLEGMWVDVDATLATYADWTNRDSWPRRQEHDRPSDLENKVSPLDKPGIVGAFCRAFSISKAIEHFGLPYVPTAVEGRWTYTAGSRPEGAIVYDDDTKLHSHHDTDPARGQSNAFDLVRAHRFHTLDDSQALALPVTERPSYRAMCKLAQEQPELQQATAKEDFQALGPIPADFEPLTPQQETQAHERSATLFRHVSDLLKNPTRPRWLIRDVLERAVTTLMIGPPGSFKSFIALDWALRVATTLNEPVCVVSAEGGDLDRRVRAWFIRFCPERSPDEVPLFVLERRLNLAEKEGIDLIRADCVALNIRPVLFVLDTFSKLSGGIDENDNADVKAFLGKIESGLKRADTAFDATVILVHHTGHGDQSRGRGASTFKADAEGENIVTRDATKPIVTVSRARFKASPDQPPLAYQATSIDLGYSDDDGHALTSLVMEPIEPPKAKSRKQAPQGANQVIVFDTLRDLAHDVGNGLVPQHTLLQCSMAKLPEDNEKADNRRKNMKSAIEQLISKKLIFLHPNNHVALHDVQVATEEAWLE